VYSARFALAVMTVSTALFPAVSEAKSHHRPAPPQLDFAVTPAQIRAACGRELAHAGGVTDAIGRLPPGKRSFSTVVKPLEDVAADINDNLVAETFLANVSPDGAIRDATMQCENDINDFETELVSRPEIYRALTDADRSDTAKSDADQKLTEMWIVSAKRSGAALPDDSRREFVALSQKLGTLESAYNDNLSNDHTTMRLSAARAGGLPPDFLAGLARVDDDYVVPVNESTYRRFMASADDEPARKAYYVATQNIGYPKNVELLKSAIAIRDRLAHLLSYNSWADYVLSDRMASSPARVDAFLRDLDAELLPRAKVELAQLTALKAKDLAEPAATLEAWDVPYYNAMLRKTKFAIDANDVRQYFPVDHTVTATMDIYANLLGITMSEMKPADAWAEGVTKWSVADTATGKPIGIFYLDMFPRDGKYGHVASFALLPNRVLPNGTVRPPVSAIVGDWPRAEAGRPALLSHEEVATFFHEFGHTMASLLAAAPYETLSSGFRWDFVEAPSQMLENWVWDENVLRKLSSEVDTGLPMPDDTIKKLIAARHVDDAYFTTRQVMLATVDLRYHSSGPVVDTGAVWAQVARTTTPMALAEGTHPEASFSHLMGGYDAGYYGYLWSKVYAQDMFSMFEKNGLENRTIGERYRTDILEPARQYEPDVEVARFLGRPVSLTAFYRDFGIDARHRRL
jgi:thimet oligopeptidase